MSEEPHEPLKISPFNQAVLDLVEKIKPLLAGHNPSVQGAVCGELTSIWLAGHTPELRDELLELHLSYVASMTPVNARALNGEHLLEPDGHAVVMSDGAFVGIWRDREIAEKIMNRSPRAKSERIRPMIFADQE